MTGTRAQLGNRNKLRRQYLPAHASLCRLPSPTMIASGHITEFLQGLQTTFDLKSRGCLARRVSNRGAFFLDKNDASDEAGTAVPAIKFELEKIDRFSLGTVAVRGLVDPLVYAGTYIGFAGVPVTHSNRILEALHLVASVLPALLLRTK